MEGNSHRGLRFFVLMERLHGRQSASFETDAVGATPKGWIATSTGGGNRMDDSEQDQTRLRN